MARLYVDNDMAHFTRRDITHVDMELHDGRKFDNLEPHRLFPLSDPRRYIGLLDEKGVEKAIIRDLMSLSEAERAVVESCLEEYYLIPKVTRINECREKFGVLSIHVDTDCGPALIEIRNVIHGVKLLGGNRILLRDNNDNRYEVPDLGRLDKRSRQLIDAFL